MLKSAPPSRPVIGRFAPSPTGALHFGSVVAAVGSYLSARSQGGQWHVRIEDVDTPRTVPGAADQILKTLENLGLMWDGSPVWQHQRLAHYRAALEQLRAQGLAYACACTRNHLAQAPLAQDGARQYPGTCRSGLPDGVPPRAWRFRTNHEPCSFNDIVQGKRQTDLENEVGDFILYRADGLFAYQLAVVVDDADLGVTEVVRGADLLDSTGRQIALQRALGVATPRYAHLPVALNAQGQKLSKQTQAKAVDNLPARQTLFAALAFLGQIPPAELRGGPPAELLTWAQAHWQWHYVPKRLGVPAPNLFTDSPLEKEKPCSKQMPN